MTTPYTPADLTPLERAYLGILAMGLAPARLARDPSLRLDYVTAVAAALLDGQSRDHHLAGPGTEVTPEFTRALTDAVLALDAKGILFAAAPPPPDIAGDPEFVRAPAPRVLDFDNHPRIQDRYLAQQCMDAILRHPAAYEFLMAKYQDSGDVWGRLYHDGHGRFR